MTPLPCRRIGREQRPPVAERRGEVRSRTSRSNSSSRRVGERAFGEHAGIRRRAGRRARAARARTRPRRRTAARSVASAAGRTRRRSRARAPHRAARRGRRRRPRSRSRAAGARWPSRFRPCRPVTSAERLIARAPASTVLARSAARMPPSISRSAPVIVRASSLARNETAAATSRACTSRPSGGRVHSEVSGSASRPATVVTMPGSVSPGQTAFTRTPSGPASTASMRVSMISGALRDRVRADRRLAPHAGVGGDEHHRTRASRAARAAPPGRSGTGATRFVAMTVSHCSSVVCESVASHSTPALRTTMSRPPSRRDGLFDRARHRGGVARVGAHERAPVRAATRCAARLVAPGEDDARARPRSAA